MFMSRSRSASAMLTMRSSDRCQCSTCRLKPLSSKGFEKTRAAMQKHVYTNTQLYEFDNYYKFENV